MKGQRCLTLFTVGLILFLAACGDSITPTGSPASQAVTSSTTSSTSQVKIVWWHLQTTEPGKSVWQQMANAYMQLHPNVTIEIHPEGDAFKDKLALSITAGKTPDLFQSWGGGALQTYAKAGQLKDITAQLQGNWGDSFSKPVLDQYSFAGKYYGVPWDIGMVGFWYNKALFKKAGISAPPQTWSELLGDVKALKAAGIIPIALGNKEKWTGAFYWEYLATRIGGKDAFDKAYNRAGSFNDPAFVEAGKRLQELMALEPFEKNYTELSVNDQYALMGNGVAAMELMGQWAPSVEKDNSTSKQGIGSDLGFFPFPAVEGGVGQITDVLGGGNGFVIGKNAPAETVDFLRFLTQLDNQRLLATNALAIPPIKGAETTITDPLLKQIHDTVVSTKYFQLYYDQFLPNQVGSTVNDTTEKLLSGAFKPEDVAQKIADAYAVTANK